MAKQNKGVGMGQNNRRAGPSGRDQFGVTQDDVAALRDSQDKKRAKVARNREYFESGCLCIQDGLIEKKDENFSDSLAVQYYEQNCSCSRNYVESK